MTQYKIKLLCYFYTRNKPNTFPGGCCIQVTWEESAFKSAAMVVQQEFVCTWKASLHKIHRLSQSAFDSKCQYNPKIQKYLLWQQYGHHVFPITNECFVSKLCPFFSHVDTRPFPVGLECSIWHYVFLLHHMKCSSIGNCCPLRCISKVLKPSPKL